MKTTRPLLLLALAAVCKLANAQPATTAATVDPYFAESTDTIASHAPRCITRNILQDKKGNFWFACWQGIVRYDGKTFINFTLKDNLIHFHVLSLFEDSKGNLWFGTVRGGLYRYDGSSFTLFTTKDGLGNNSITCMMEDKAGNLWFGTDGGATRYDGKTFTNFTTQNGLSNNSVSSIIQDRSGRIWVVGSSISCYDGQTFSAFKDNNGQPFTQARYVLEDKSGNIYIGSGDGLQRYNGKDLSSLHTDAVCSLNKDRAGNLWLSVSLPPVSNMRGQALYRYNGQAFEEITRKTAANDSQVFGVMEDDKGKIWFGTMNGPCRFEPAQANNPCVRRTCTHNMPMRQAMEEHNQQLAKAFDYFL